VTPTRTGGRRGAGSASVGAAEGPGVGRGEGLFVGFVDRVGGYSALNAVLMRLGSMNGMSRYTSLFTPAVAEHKLHPNFTALRDAEHLACGRRLMDDLFVQMGAPRAFLFNFQAGGFHGRIFELACYAYLTSCQLAVDYRLDRPDFIASRDGTSIAVEASVASPSEDQLEDISIGKLAPLSDKEVLDKVSNDFPIRMGRVLEKKLRHRYWEHPDCAGRPLVFAVSPLFESGSVTYTDDALVGYLYGFATEHHYRDRKLPSGFFLRPDAHFVSAVLFTNQFTVPRFYRLAADEELNRRLVAMREGWYYRKAAVPEFECGQYRYRVGHPLAPDEPWCQGVTLFLNPLASTPLPEGLLRATSVVRVDYDGNVVREVNGLHTLTSFMMVSPDGSA
jgi:hypothetical protein